ncbi:serine/threonine-protein kinase [Scytonema sp. HK-05]|uniref:serine/threonine-protein kinase n=1 Tax=Scytonema sp. HK-05 TaxID=1137095 RepID=UPI0009369E70|nr:serine/threonine-protein kinase [Scytonema sp. HK-05]OKH54024.1 serine/threonine protein kinase [Scytonema sp. HK-05]
MNSAYCSKGHENPTGSRFCLHCGEKLDYPVSQGIQGGQTLGDGAHRPSVWGDRYLILRQLGQGGFGRTYLAEDVNRFRELCVLKEFSPQVQTPYVLQKAEELFQREASVLYKLQHPQIPRFRELFRMNLAGKEYLFLVQDYVQGETYRSLLDARKQQGLLFTEAEVRLLLQQILPVLEYIHSMGVIHRDISPDNLILRTPQASPYQGETGRAAASADLNWREIEAGMPVLIDFGGVKQVAATVVSQYYQPGAAASPLPTLLGKAGYSPPEQMQTGLVEPHSDLYALAATVLVLLTGKQPQELIDNYTLTWQWRREVNLSPTFGMMLDKMLSPTPAHRYQSAHQVLQALTVSPVGYPPPQQIPPPTPPPPQTEQTLAVASSPTPPTLPTPSTPPTPATSSRSWWTPGKIIVIAMVMATAISVGMWGATQLLDSSSPIISSDDPKLPPEEQQRKQRLDERRQYLGINEKFFITLVNQVFWDRNPSLRSRTLTQKPEDAQLRAEWDSIAGELLEKLAVLSSDARKKLGSFTHAERDRAKVEVNQVNVGSRSLYDLGDAAFFQQFPEQRGKNFIDQPIGQIWHGFISDKLNAILAGSAFKKIVFDKGAISTRVSGTLKPGEGKVFIAALDEEQLMKVKLSANSKILLSVYSPSGKVRFLEDSTQRSLSVKLPETGFYEYVVVSTASKTSNYTLSITAENPAPLPSPTPTPTETITPTSTPTPTETITPTSTPTPTETITPTSTPTPTETITPTSTPTPTPTPTSTPTASPTPTPTPTPTPS